MAKKKTLTIRERVETLAKNYLSSEADEYSRGKFITEVMELIERAKSPDMFCAKCDMRMSIDLESNSLECFNCGNKIKLTTSKTYQPVSVPKAIPPEPVRRTEIKPGGKPDQKLMQAIDNAEKASKKPSLGEQIRKLADSRGSSKPTREDEEAVKNSIPGGRGKNTDINWC